MRERARLSTEIIIISAAMEMEVNEESVSKVVPEGVMEAVNTTLLNVQQLSADFDQFLSLSQPEVIANLPPLHRAHSLLTLAAATTALFAVRLRCTGVHPDLHKLKGDLERVSRYKEKLERYLDLDKAPLQPSTALNLQATNRFIGHSLPDLTAEQRRSLREINRNEAGRVNYNERNFQRKRKYEAPWKPEKPSIQASVQEFLEKAACELPVVPEEEQAGTVHEEPIVPILIEDSSDSDFDELESDFEEDQEAEENEEERVKGIPDPASAIIIIDSSDED